jgi:hypothetical protein
MGPQYFAPQGAYNQSDNSRALKTLRLVTILLVASSYLVMVVVPIVLKVVGIEDKEHVAGFVLLVVLVLALSAVVAIINVVTAIRWYAKRDTRLVTLDEQRAYNRVAVWMKMALVPFYVVNFVFCFIVYISTWGIGVIVWPFSGFLCFVLLIGTSAFSWSALAVQAKRKMMTSGQTALRAILQGLYVVDVVTVPFIAHRLNYTLVEARPVKRGFQVLLWVVLGVVLALVVAVVVWVVSVLNS